MTQEQQRQIRIMIEDITTLYKEEKISQKTYEYLIYEVCVRWIEQMVEDKIENQLNRLVSQFEQKALEMRKNSVLRAD